MRGQHSCSGVIIKLYKLPAGVVGSDVDNNSEKTVRGLLLLCSVDLQAKALLAHKMQYNGEFCCNNCEDKSKSVRGKGGHRIWPYEGPTTLRTHRKCKEYLAIVSDRGEGNEPVPISEKL
uniref:Uncharacterized protein n=1 Tax=Branchiostoma floridae TaxID=7739 RepID=C3ZUS0_BRAFL|eukprot:XP_002587771.1 hypothetical protein BRAFLDRAFT_94674 [Branchiostoma floridae]